jgi:hypothetical protein
MSQSTSIMTSMYDIQYVKVKTHETFQEDAKAYQIYQHEQEQVLDLLTSA